MKKQAASASLVNVVDFVLNVDQMGRAFELVAANVVDSLDLLVIDASNLAASAAQMADNLVEGQLHFL